MVVKPLAFPLAKDVPRLASRKTRVPQNTSRTTDDVTHPNLVTGVDVSLPHTRIDVVVTKAMNVFSDVTYTTLYTDALRRWHTGWISHLRRSTVCQSCPKCSAIITNLTKLTRSSVGATIWVWHNEQNRALSLYLPQNWIRCDQGFCIVLPIKCFDEWLKHSERVLWRSSCANTSALHRIYPTPLQACVFKTSGFLVDRFGIDLVNLCLLGQLEWIVLRDCACLLCELTRITKSRIKSTVWPIIRTRSINHRCRIGRDSCAEIKFAKKSSCNKRLATFIRAAYVITFV